MPTNYTRTGRDIGTSSNTATLSNLFSGNYASNYDSEYWKSRYGIEGSASNVITSAIGTSVSVDVIHSLKDEIDMVVKEWSDFQAQYFELFPEPHLFSGRNNTRNPDDKNNISIKDKDIDEVI